MPITEGEWASIRAMAEQVAVEVSGTRKDYFVMGKVIKRDPVKNLIWMTEFGDQPIPLFSFDYEVFYYAGTPLRKKTAKVKPACPKIGQTVLVAREMGLNRLPRCLGVLRSKGFVI